MSPKIVIGKREMIIMLSIGFVSALLNQIFMAGTLLGTVVISVVFGIFWGNYDKARSAKLARDEKAVPNDQL